MSASSQIEWTDGTWNFLVGCSKCSSGCAGCYAIKDVLRMGSNPNPKVAAANREDAHVWPRRALRLAPVQHRRVGHVVGRDGRLQHRYVEVAALAGAVAAPQRREDGPEGVGAGQYVGGL